MNARYRNWRLLVRMLFAPDEARLRERIGRELGDDLDAWSALLSVANAELVSSALWLRLGEAGLADAIPGSVAEYLDAFATFNRQRNERIRSQTLECIAALADGGIVSMPIKGAAYLLDDDDALPRHRLVADIDLVVPAERVDDASRLLASRGFRPSAGQQDDLRGHHHVDPLGRPDDMAPVELHHAFVRDPLGPMLPVAEVWRNGAERMTAGVTYRLPGVSDSVALLVAHAAITDRYVRTLAVPLRALVDLDWLLTKFGDAVDFELIVARARAVGAEAELGRFLGLLGVVGSPAAPDGPRPSLADRCYYRCCLVACAFPGLEKWAERADRLSKFQMSRYYVDELESQSLLACRLSELRAMWRRATGREASGPG